MSDEKDINLHIKSMPIKGVMEDSYLAYAMSVIVSRALPDVRDGLKPVHRRILYAMHREGLQHSKSYSKCAGIVGEVLKKYHPHGDTAVYDALVRFAQDWNLRYPLVDGQGNFGSVDGDPAAAYRYTEARMENITEELLSEIDKETVDFVPNFDGKHEEPKVLPARIPQLLLNGTVGIAVGMATSIPPHNLRELSDALVTIIDDPDIEVGKVADIIQGPDFPTGGIIYNPKDIKIAYTTGKGKVVTRAVAKIEEGDRGSFRIIVTELPYQVNKSTLLEKIADLVKSKKIVSVSDLRDESDRDGIRMVIELKKDAYPKKILNQLFKLTPMQSSFHVNMLALVDGIQPRVLNIKEALSYFIEHRVEVVRRRSEYELRRAEERAHILEGFIIALKNLDAVIKLIRASKTREEAHAGLMKKFALTDIQANAILEMRLAALVALERNKIDEEHKEKKKIIAHLKDLLKSPVKIKALIRKELLEIKEKYGDERRTDISKTQIGKFEETDLIPDENVIVSMTNNDYIKRIPIGTYKSQGRGGVGVRGFKAKDEDNISADKIIVTKNHDNILFFTNRGRVFKIKVYEIPQMTRIAKGQSIVNLIQLAPEEHVTGTITVRNFSDDHNFLMVTKGGVVKKTPVNKYQNIRTGGLIAIKLQPNDELRWILLGRPTDNFVIVTAEGKAILAKTSDARPQGRATMGVRGIRLRGDDVVIGADISTGDKDETLLIIGEKGLGKRTSLSQYTLQHRGGMGVKTANVTSKTGKLVYAKLIKASTGDLLISSAKGSVIRLSIKSVKVSGRATQGVKLIRLKAGDRAVGWNAASDWVVLDNARG